MLSNLKLDAIECWCLINFLFFDRGAIIEFFIKVFLLEFFELFFLDIPYFSTSN